MIIDDIQLNFNPESLILLNIIIALVMFGVALDIKVEDFLEIKKNPKSIFIGLLSQFILFPLITFLILLIIDPIPSISLGMILIAACPGGNLSNFLTNISKGNTALSIGMSYISTLLSIIMTPINLSFWGSLLPQTNALLNSVSISFFDVLKTILIILIIPTLLGVFFQFKFPKYTIKMKQFFKILGFLVFIIFIIIAFILNYEYFINVIDQIFLIVLIINSIGLFLGFIVSKIFKLNNRDLKAITFEVGIQNTAFGLILVFSFFDGLGGMAISAAWWGIWHVISGMILANYFKRNL